VKRLKFENPDVFERRVIRELDKKSSPFGTATEAGQFAGRGVMVGGNADVWNQVKKLDVDVVAVIPGTGFDFSPARTIVWHPPQFHGGAPIVQAESQAEWNTVKDLAWDAISINAREYGRLDGKVAIVEAYYNEGQGADFNYFKGYVDLGARAVIPMIGGYSAPGRSDAEAGAIYRDLAEWASGRMPGFWAFAGESLLTDESIEALALWRP